MTDPNVLLVVLDSVRKSAVDAAPTPFFDTAADWASVYHQARAPAIWTVPSHASLWTGLYPPEHGVEGVQEFLYPESTVWDTLSEDGYRTGLFTYNGLLLGRDNGLEVPFDYKEETPFVPYPDVANPLMRAIESGGSTFRSKLKHCLRTTAASPSPSKSFANLLVGYYRRRREWSPNQVRDKKYVDRFLSWLDRNASDEPWGACLNLMDAHLPYIAPDAAAREMTDGDVEEAVAIQDGVEHSVYQFLNGDRSWEDLESLLPLYHAAIAGIDRQLERLCDALRDRGEFDETLIVIVGDHGEGFGEESYVEPDSRIVAHRLGVHECLSHVPLYVKYPEQGAGTERHELATITGFPAAVEAARNGERDDHVFLTDEVCVNDPHPRSNEGLNAAAEWCDDLTPFNTDRRAVYRWTADGDIVKYLAAEYPDCTRQSIKITFSTGAEPYTTGPKPTDYSVIAEAFEAFELKDVADISHDQDALAPETETRLERLGYL